MKRSLLLCSTLVILGGHVSYAQTNPTSVINSYHPGTNIPSRTTTTHENGTTTMTMHDTNGIAIRSTQLFPAKG